MIQSCVIPPVGDFTTLDLKLECATGPNLDETWPRNEQRVKSLDARHSRKPELGVDALNWIEILRLGRLIEGGKTTS